MKWKFWKRSRKAIGTGVMLSNIGDIVWTPKDYANFAKETYMKNVIAFRCIDLIAKSVSQVPWKVLRDIGEGDKEEVYDHYMNALLKRPNPENSWTSLQYNATSYLCMAGNSFIQKIPIGESVKELWTLQPNRMKINVNKITGVKLGYIYTYENTDYPFEVDPITGNCDVLHLKTFNPLDEFWGMAVTEPASYEIDTANSSIKWNKKLTDNEARPGMMLLFEQSLGDEQYKRLKETMDKEREGSENAGKTLILEGARDARPYGFNPKEMDWIQSNLELARRICNAWGVPPQLVGIPDTSTYSNYKEARTAFWEDTVLFYLELYRNEYNYWIFGRESDIYLIYDLNSVPAMQYKKDMQWDRAQKSDFLTINEKRAMTENDPVDDGDVILISATMIPLGMETETETQIEEEEGEAEEGLKNLGFDENEIQDMMEEKPYPNEHA